MTATDIHGYTKSHAPSVPRSFVWQNQRRRKLTPPAAGRVRAMPLTGHRRSVEHRDDEQDWERAHLFTALALATRRWSVWSIASIASIAPSPP